MPKKIHFSHKFRIFAPYGQKSQGNHQHPIHQSTQLLIKHCHESLPVSRSNMAQVKAAIKQG
jgi:hypothetical protein